MNFFPCVLPHNWSPKARVTIFCKAKIGTLDDEFSRDEIYGPSNVFFIKSGTVRCGCRLDCRGNDADLKPKTKIGVISKKKGHRLLVPRFVSFSSPKVKKFCNRAGVDLFFFFGDHPNFRLCFQISTLASTIKPATASHHPALVGKFIAMSINLVKSVVFHWSKKRDLRSKKRDKASKSGTVPPKAGRMVTLPKAAYVPTAAGSASLK